MPSLAVAQSRKVGSAEDIRRRTHEVLDILPPSDDSAAVGCTRQISSQI